MSLKSEILYQGKALTLKLEEAEFPGGQRAMQEIVHHPGGAAIVALNNEREVCLLRQFRYAAKGWLWELPAGRVEKDEDPLSTAKRELAEEAGVVAGHWQQLTTILPSPGICDERIYIFQAEDLSVVESAHEILEYIEIHWVPVEKAIDWIRQGIILDAKTIAGLFFIYANLRVNNHSSSSL